MKTFTDGDMFAINTWRIARGLPAQDRSLYPRIGLVEPQVAAGFLYATDSCLCMLDGFITNPNASMLKRGRALDKIADVLIELARHHGYKRIVAISSNGGILRLAEKKGLSYEPGLFQVYTKEL